MLVVGKLAVCALFLAGVVAFEDWRPVDLPLKYSACVNKWVGRFYAPVQSRY